MPWWRNAVIYQVYPRSFADADGDGIGDLPGITAQLPHLAELGVDAVWLSPFYPSPQADAGYDVADYRDVDPIFGTLADFDTMLAEAHRLGLRVIVDLVPNHTSVAHPWFTAAVQAGRGNAERERYIFREGQGEHGEQPPNNWQSRFGGPAWTRIADGSWYLHMFDSGQPDLNWKNPAVRADFEAILRFWLDRGVDGFRVDVAHGLVKRDGLPDNPATGPAIVPGDGAPMWDQDGVHEIYRGWRRLVDGYPGDRMLVAEAWVDPPERLARYLRRDEMHQAFNFAFLTTGWSAAALRDVIDQTLEVDGSVGATTTWVLSNHDVIRHASRLGFPDGEFRKGGIGVGDPLPDPVLGLRRARAATLLALALPGSAYLYQGEELGLPEDTGMPDEVRQDPTWRRSGHAVRGRDGCRVPIPWVADAPAYGFSPTGRSWLPQPRVWRELALDRQRGVAGSTYEMYRWALALRREWRLADAQFGWADGFPPDAVAFTGNGLLIVTNLGAEPVTLPAGTRILIASADVRDQRVGSDVTVWAELS